MGDGLVELSAASQGDAEVVVGQGILRGTGHRVGPERLAIAPVDV